MTGPLNARIMTPNRLSWPARLRVKCKEMESRIGSKVMQASHIGVPGVTDDPIIRLLLEEKARTLHEAEEMYLDSAIPEILELLASPLDNQELSNHPLLK